VARTAKPGRKWLWRIIGVLVLVAIAAAAWLWWDVQRWRPAEDAYPEQGVLVAQHHGQVNFRTLAAIGGSFAYIEASIGADGKDSSFGSNFTRARDAGLLVGAVHLFDPCTKADGQSANFVTMVPRTDKMLPSAIALGRTADDCAERVSEAAVESELMTFINQVEKHTGKPVILKVKPQFEAAYTISGKLERQLWVNRTRFEPGYTQRPWLLWSANEGLVSEASEEPLEWVVVRP